MSAPAAAKLSQSQVALYRGCVASGKRSGWKFDWADAALHAKIKKTEQDAKNWIVANNLGGKKPQPRSLLRWMKELVDHGGRIGAFGTPSS